MEKIIAVEKCKFCGKLCNEGYIVDDWAFVCSEGCAEHYIIDDNSSIRTVKFDLMGELPNGDVKIDGKRLLAFTEETISYIKDLIEYDDMDDDTKLESIKEYLTSQTNKLYGIH